MTEISIVGCDADAAQLFAGALWPRANQAELGAPFAWTVRRFGYAAVEGEEKVGVVLLACIAGVGRIEDLIVAPDYRRRGIGSTLLQRAEDAASYQNCHKIIASVKEGGSAGAFFEKHRYRVAAMLERHYFQTNFVEMIRWLW